jgi:hypothetical protein
MKVYLHHNSYSHCISIRQVYWNYKTKQDTRTCAQMSILTMSRTFAFAPASNKHLIASVKPFSAAFTKGLSPGLALLTLAPPYQMQVWQANYMVVLSLVQRWTKRTSVYRNPTFVLQYNRGYYTWINSFAQDTKDLRNAMSRATNRRLPLLGWKKIINNLIFMPKYDSRKENM